MYKVSILIPVYNEEKYLHDCLESVIQQTLENIEIICINDGSTDGSKEILYDYSNKDKRIVIVDKQNTGYGHSMNCGLDIAKGEYIGIVESDDFVSPIMFERLYKEAKNNNADAIKSNYWEYSAQERKFHELLAGYTYYKVLNPANEKMILCNEVNTWSGIYKRSFLQKNGIRFNESPGASYQDIGFSIKVMACAKRVFLIHEAFYNYRIDNPEASVKSKDKPKCVFDEIDSVWNYLNERPSILKKVKYQIPAIQFLRFRETYDRVNMKHKAELLYELKSRYSDLEKMGYIKESFWDPEVWRVFKRVGIEDFDRFADRQELFLETKGFFDLIAGKRETYIYGAGIVGKWMFSFLKQKGLSVNGFLVTDKNDNPDSIENTSVYLLKKKSKTLHNATILVAVKDEDQLAIISKLKSMGIKDVISVNKQFRAKLTEWEKKKDMKWEESMFPIPR